MNAKTLSKLPEESLRAIHYAWRVVTYDTSSTKEEIFQFTAGILAGLNYAGIVSDEERQELFRYYKKWFMN